MSLSITIFSHRMLLTKNISALTLGFSIISLPLHAQEKAEETVISDTQEEAKEVKEQKILQSRIILTNGDRLSGQPHSIDAQGSLEFTSSSLRQKAKFPLNKVLSLELNSWKSRPLPETTARIQVQPRYQETSGDTLLGGLHELTPENIKLKTWYGGIISLKRSMVKSLQIINSGPGNYHGPNNIKEWSFDRNPATWRYKNGSLISKSSGSVGRDVELTEQSHISFEAKWKESMRFRIHLYSSDVEDSSPDAYYDINFNRTYVYLRTRGKSANGRGVRRGGRWKQIKQPTTSNKAKFDMYIDRKTGTITVYINDEHSCILQSQSPDPSDLGTGLAFIAEERYPIEISNINVTPWNGKTFPKQQLAIEPKKSEENEDKKELPPHRIILSNGDEVPGTVGKVQDNRMIIETEYTPIQIPIKRIKTLSLGSIGEEPKKYSQDVRAWFHEGGHVTLKLATFKDDKISGFSQAFGEVSFDLRAFSKIDFHIYDKKYNDKRAETK